ncbi:uncharacterized protein LOC127858526 isoform X2 [Dreissena polymorpha]|uniref:uncharacterized protein LOC127858526 isoform X2 n=1 Tax=Dreissena polymorpha TaxID=45954 RepID=UPI0022653E11|nr:uncharacterized protein LOC127858526 isoform X2 [Dreissena polymorpha]
MEQELTDEELRNWVKACLGLKYFKEGVLPCIADACTDLYIRRTSQMETLCNLPNYTCTGCDVGTLEPKHTKMHKCRNTKCNCKKKQLIRCKENEACGVMYDLIIDEHVGSSPNWVNTECDLWSDKDTGPWELIKCFISTPGYKDKRTIAEADVTALIQIYENNTALKALIGLDLEKLIRIRKVRNDICHTGDMKVSRNTLCDYIADMKTALRLNIFSKYESTKAQLKKLTKLEKDSYKVTRKDELESRQDMIKAIQESKQIAILQGEQMDKIENNIQNLTRIEKLHAKKYEDIISNLKSHVTSLLEEIMKTTKLILKTDGDFKVAVLDEIGKVAKELQEQGILLQEQGILLQKMNVQSKGMKMALERLEKILQKTEGQEINIETMIRVCLHVISTSEREHISEMLVQIANGVTNNFDPTIVQHVKSALNALQRDGIKLKKAQKECVALYLSCPTPEKWMQLCSDCLDGSLTELFKPLQTCLRERLDCQILELKVDINESDFLVALAEILDHIDHDGTVSGITHKVVSQKENDAKVLHSNQTKENEKPNGHSRAEFYKTTIDDLQRDRSNYHTSKQKKLFADVPAENIFSRVPDLQLYQQQHVYMDRLGKDPNSLQLLSSRRILRREQVNQYDPVRLKLKNTDEILNTPRNVQHHIGGTHKRVQSRRIDFLPSLSTPIPIQQIDDLQDNITRIDLRPQNKKDLNIRRIEVRPQHKNVSVSPYYSPRHFLRSTSQDTSSTTTDVEQTVKVFGHRVKKSKPHEMMNTTRNRPSEIFEHLPPLEIFGLVTQKHGNIPDQHSVPKSAFEEHEVVVSAHSRSKTECSDPVA